MEQHHAQNICIGIFVFVSLSIYVFLHCAGWVGCGGEGGDQSNGACMMGIFDTFVFFVFVHICVFVDLCICVFLCLYFFRLFKPN